MTTRNLERFAVALFAIAALGIPLGEVHAIAKFARVTGNWTAGTVWFTTNCATATATTAPVAADTATICTGTNVTLNTLAATRTVTINAGGTLTHSANTLTLNANNNAALIPFTMGGTYTASGGATVAINSDANTTLTAGAATTFFNLTINPPPGGTPRTYTFGAATLTINNDFLISVQSAGAGVRAVTVNLGAATTVVGTTTIQAAGNETANLSTTAANLAFTSGRLVIGTAGTFTANNSTVTLNATSGTLFTRTGIFTPGGSNVIMNPASGSPTLTSGTLTFNDLTINMAGQTGTLGNTITVSSDLAINNGTLADGGFQITGNATGLLTAAAGAGLTLGIAGTATTFPTLFTAGNTTLNGTSTVTYASGVAQNVSTVPTYGNLTFSGASLKTTTPAGTMTIAGDWAIGGVGSSTDLTTNLTPVTMTGTTKQISGLVAGGITIPTLTVNGTVTNNATGTVLVSTALSGTGTLTQGTNALLTINGTSGIGTLDASANPNLVTYSAPAATQTVKSATYHNLTINNALNVSLGGNATVNGALTFTAGDITTGANTLTIGASGSTAGTPGTTRHVVGNMEKVFLAIGSFTYTVGDGTNYTPLTVTFFTLPTPGNLTVSATSGEHPDTTAGTSSLVRSAQGVNRYWTLKASTLAGIFSAAPTYVAGDLDALATYPNFSVSRGTTCSGTRTCASWALQSLGAPAPSATLITATAMSMTSGAAESDLVVGEPTLPRVRREKEFIFTRELY